MSIILIGCEKGGTGKTTIAVNLAVMRAQAGRDVLLLDTDQQGNASFWVQIRDENQVLPRIACVSKFGQGIRHEVRDLGTRYDDIVIDAGGRDSVELRSAMVIAERIYIPSKPSQFDLWTLTRMSQLVDQALAINENLKASIVISCASSNPLISEANEAQELIADLENKNIELAKSVIRDRIVYRKAARMGLGVTEFEPNDVKAIQEMRSLYEEIYND